jgi:hypothetical protein
MAPRWQYCLHRVIIDTSLVNRVARKFPKKAETTNCSDKFSLPADDGVAVQLERPLAAGK